MPLPLSVDGEGELKETARQIKAFELFATEPTALLCETFKFIRLKLSCGPEDIRGLVDDALHYMDEVDYLKQDQAGISPDVVEAVSFEDRLLAPILSVVEGAPPFEHVCHGPDPPGGAEERSLDKATKMLLWFQDQFVRYPLFDRDLFPKSRPLRALIRGLAGPAQPQRAARPQGAKWSLAHCQRAWRSNSIADRQVKLGWWLIFLNQMVRVYPSDPSTTAFLKHNMHSFILTRASSENVSLFQTFFAGLDDIRRAAVDAAVADPHPRPVPHHALDRRGAAGDHHAPPGSPASPLGERFLTQLHSGSTATLRRAGPTRHRLGGQQQDRASSVMLAPAAKVAAGARKLGLVVAVERVWLQVDPQTCRVLKRGERVDEPFQQVFTSVLPGAFRLFTNRATWTPYSASSALAASGGGGGGGHLGNRTHASSFRTAGRASTTTLGTSLRALIPEMPRAPRRPSLAGPGLCRSPGVGARLGQASLKYLPEAVRGASRGQARSASMCAGRRQSPGG
ncbi:hypothetical protein PAPYR_8476 [Paratrimastix pyriformis]|uniref:Uncharacterized protein n=1 Tax=Paratrimastix pyriformis TaxID=342808 RepID=A0ABQ8UAM4_9EUKA|nr:hypothetical protein PAPYR_8476 [Paratrimastix pyriformis]